MRNKEEVPEVTVRQRIVESPFTRLIFIVGKRGAGKTEYLNACKELLKNRPNYLVIELNNDHLLINHVLIRMYRNLPESIAAKLTDTPVDRCGAELEKQIKEIPGPLLSDRIEKVVQVLNERGITPIIAMDDVVLTEQLKSLVQIFAMVKRHGRQIFILLAGLPNSVDQIQREKNITFLLRADKIELPSDY